MRRGTLLCAARMALTTFRLLMAADAPDISAETWRFSSKGPAREQALT
jgi:hypothetical protein